MPLFSRLSFRRASRCALCLALFGSGCAERPPPAKNVTVVKSGDTTVVAVEDDVQEPESADCKRYCERLSACWYAVPNADPMLAPKDVLAKCWTEQHHCRTPTTALHCCGAVNACGDFVKCESTAQDMVTDCERAIPKPPRQASGSVPPT
ncbi:MAG TPA: hypothetical protein VHU80_04610 [Polyangiaceae bacterium]|jgi:hypothetical protein|nr:hypothetical protein [Polyangiaceae bacterium]